jgi:DNA-binding LytR/AlgR family response regulator
MAYGLGSILYYLSLRRSGRQEGAAVQATAAPATFDIRDGARLVRALVGEILAVRSAGNYSEFLLEDGRQLLMRSSLSALETRLGEHGFVRTHRSWLVNPSRVTGLRPEGSGDYAIELGEIEAPLSRRFPQALAALRG